MSRIDGSIEWLVDETDGRVVGQKLLDGSEAPLAELAAMGANSLVRPSLPSHIHISIGTPPTATDGAAHTYDVQIPAKRAFFGVRFMYLNYSTAAAMNITAARCGAAPKHLTSYGDEISWWPSLLTVGGASSFSVPSAKSGITANHIIPGVKVTDFVPLQPIARTDSATYGDKPLVRVRSRSAAEVQYPYSVGAGFAPAWNASTETGDLKIGSYMATGDYATAAPTDHVYTVTENGGFISPTIAIFSYVEPGRSLFAFGDSLIQGNGSSIGPTAANGFFGWPLRLHCQSDDIDVCNFAVTGQKTGDSVAVMRAVISAMDDYPTYAALKVYSPNDGLPTQAIIDAAWGYILDGVSYLRSKGITPILVTSPPVNAWTTAQHEFNEAQNARVATLVEDCPWIMLLDMHAIVADPTNTRAILPAYAYSDNQHLSDAGYQAVADEAMRVLSI